MADTILANSAKIGTTLGGMVTLASLGISAPRYDPVTYAVTAKMASGLVVARGFRSSRWYWDRQLTRAEITAFRTYCPNTSALVYISTPTNDAGTYDDFECIMFMNPENEKGFTFDIPFTQMIEA
jgi:hypothetical protein